MRYLFGIILSLFLIQPVNAQDVEMDNSPAEKTAIAVYANMGTPTLFTINLDTRFTKRQDGIGGRFGLGAWPTSDDLYIMIPIELNYLLGKNDHYFNAGIGMGIVLDAMNNDIMGYLNLGYRYAPKRKGIIFKIAYAPFIAEGWRVPYGFSLAVGYKFQ